MKTYLTQSGFSKIETLIIGILVFIFSAVLYEIYDNSILAGVIGVCIGTVLGYFNVFLFKRIYEDKTDIYDWDGEKEYYDNNLFKIIHFLIFAIILFFLLRDWYVTKRFFHAFLFESKVIESPYVNFFIVIYPYLFISLCSAIIIYSNICWKVYNIFYAIGVAIIVCILYFIFKNENIFAYLLYVLIYSFLFNFMQIFQAAKEYEKRRHENMFPEDE